MKCRHCGNVLKHTFLDLGFAPPSNAYLTEADLVHPEKYFPLKLKVCDWCWLVQTEDYAQADELFDENYSYFSSTSSSWVAHAARYARNMIEGLGLTEDSLVIEVASNDGYLLRNFVEAGIPCLGIEPTSSTADVAEMLSIPVIREFFGGSLAKRLAGTGRQADLVLGNNVFAHVPDINDFTSGLKQVLKPGGTITLEFPHLLRMIDQTQFDTAYHEHFSYLSLTSVRSVFENAGLRVWDVDELPTHGGSLRVYGCHAEDQRQTTPKLEDVLARESNAGLLGIEVYREFQIRANLVKDELLSFLIETKKARKTVAAYGAAAKGNTLLNYAGVKPDLLPYVCDAATAKQGKFMPGSHIPILHPGILESNPPNYLLVLPWNIIEEVKTQLKHLREKGVQFVTAVPTIKVE
jgi:SAM-dependent methyltransferase